MPDARFGSLRCTGLTASWCPIHGACRCADDPEDRLHPDGDARSLDQPNCPLHRFDSAHPIALPTRLPTRSRANE